MVFPHPRCRTRVVRSGSSSRSRGGNCVGGSVSDENDPPLWGFVLVLVAVIGIALLVAHLVYGNALCAISKCVRVVP